MSVETARTIDQLDSSLPRNVDLIREGDDHLRLIKAVLKTSFPNFNSVMSMSSDKLNNLDKALTATDKDGNLTFGGAMTMTQGKTLNMGNNRLQNVSNPAADTDAVTLGYLKSPAARSLAYPVGSIYLSINATNPAQSLGFGTWANVGQGRFLVGVGTGTDGRGTQRGFGAGNNNNGFYETQLNANHIPPHAHGVDIWTQNGGNHQHFYNRWTRSEGGMQNAGHVGHGSQQAGFIRSGTEWGGEHNHRVLGNTQNTGGGARFDTFPVGFGVYIWQRTA